MMLLAASPGGTTANLYSHLFGGDVALNVTPDRDQLGARRVHAAGHGQPVARLLPRRRRPSACSSTRCVQVFAIVLVRSRSAWSSGARAGVRRPAGQAGADPVRRRAGRGDRRRDLAERENIADYFVAVGPGGAAVQPAQPAIGYGVPRLLGVDERRRSPSRVRDRHPQQHAGHHDRAEPALLNSTQMAIPAAVYGIVMFPVAAAVRLGDHPVRTTARPRAEGAATGG